MQEGILTSNELTSAHDWSIKRQRGRQG